MVFFKNVWILGVYQWIVVKWIQFVNDFNIFQLWVVIDNVNQVKSDKSFDLWKFFFISFYCIYVKSWVVVKYFYGLSIISVEKSVFMSMINIC